MAVRMADAYDVVVIGSGTGGYSCALRSAQLGKRVALVERDGRLGGYDGRRLTRRERPGR